MASEWTLVLGFKTKLNDHHTWSENHVFHQVAVSRERSDKWPGELIADGFLTFHEQAGNLKHHIVRVVRHNAVLVRSSPRLVVLMDERFDINNRGYRSRGCDGCFFNSRMFAHWIRSYSTQEHQVPILFFFDSWLHRSRVGVGRLRPENRVDYGK